MRWKVAAPAFMPTSKLFLTRSDLENVRKWEYKVSTPCMLLLRYAARRTERSGNDKFVSGQRPISDDTFIEPVLELARKLHPCKHRT